MTQSVEEDAGVQGPSCDLHDFRDATIFIKDSLRIIDDCRQCAECPSSGGATPGARRADAVQVCATVRGQSIDRTVIWKVQEK